MPTFTRVARLFTGQLTGSLATFYTSPAGTTTVLTACTIINDTAAVVNLTLSITPSGGSAFTIVNALALAANEAYLVPEVVRQVLQAGDVLQGHGLDLNVHLSGLTIVQS